MLHFIDSVRVKCPKIQFKNSIMQNNFDFFNVIYTV